MLQGCNTSFRLSPIKKAGDCAVYGRKFLNTTASMEKGLSPEVVSFSRKYYFNCVLFIKQKLIMISKMANWIEGKGNTNGSFSPIPTQMRGVCIHQVPEARTGVLVDQRHEERHAHQGVMSEW